MSNKREKLTNEIIDKRLESSNFIRIENYVNMRTKIDFKCKIDGYIWKAKPFNIVYGLGHCPKCSKREPINNEVIDKRLEGLNIKRLSNFEKMQIKMKFNCMVCNHIWEAKPYTITNCHQGCPICANKNKHLTNEYIDEKIKGKEFIRLGNYVDTFTPIDWKCKIDGCIWKTTYSNILKNEECPVCENNDRIINGV